jgi:TonB family protein
MTIWNTVRRVALVLMLSLLAGPASAAMIKAHQDPFARAKTLYASAEFEEALRLLETFKEPAANLEAASYQVYCLVALGREDDARKMVERIVKADPLFRPVEGQVAPRMKSFFDDARKPLLPEAARRCFATAKNAYDKKDATSAFAEFNRVIALLDEIRGGGAEMSDLRTLALAFRDLALVTAEPIVYDAEHINIIPPVPVSTPQPEWRPTLFELNKTFSGSIAVVVSEDGKVLSASIVTTVHARYDGPLLEAAKSWTFKPALRSGVPVRYRFVMPVRILR